MHAGTVKLLVRLHEESYQSVKKAFNLDEGRRGFP